MPAGDAKALADALERLALDSGARERMGARSRVIACGEFDQESVLASTLAIYRAGTRE